MEGVDLRNRTLPHALTTAYHVPTFVPVTSLRVYRVLHVGFTVTIRHDRSPSSSTIMGQVSARGAWMEAVNLRNRSLMVKLWLIDGHTE